MTTADALTLHDHAPKLDDLRAEVLAGLSRSPRQLPSKFFYDRRGSALFDRICELPEYYLTRTETRIQRDHIADITDALGPRCLLLELGSGSSIKTRDLLDHLDDPAGYIPIDISREHLLASARRLALRYPELEVLPVCADYHQPFDPPAPAAQPDRTVAYFPGSTLGNLHPPQARRLLRRVAELVGPGGGLLIGLDLRKDPHVLRSAYDDAQGVTAEFNYNLLDRINREAQGDFDRRRFEHRALWNDGLSRMESHLVSLAGQTVRVGGRAFHLDEGETIHTECSYKYTLDSMPELAGRWFTLKKVWTDDRRWFSVQYLEAR